MTSGFKTAGVDFDDIFAPYNSGSKPANTGFSVAGVDLVERYAPLAYGTPAPETGMTIADSSDVNTLWCAKDTDGYAVSPGFGGPYEAYSNGPHNTGCRFTCEISSSGSWMITLYAAPGGAGGGGGTSGVPLSGVWHSGADDPASYEVRFTAYVTDSIVTTDYPGSDWTASTSWLSLDVSRSVTADTQNHPEGSSTTSGMLSGYYLVEIRKIGTTDVVSEEVDFSLDLT